MKRAAPVWIQLVETESADPARDALTVQVKQLAITAGLSIAHITSAAPFTGLRDHLVSHLQAGHLDGFDWFDVERAKTISDPSQLMPQAQSIVSFALPYWTAPVDRPNDGVVRGRIARYAWGADYHRVLKRRMKLFVRLLEQALNRPLESRELVDTARVSDRSVAARAGLGWYGKHSCLIVPGFGSGVLLGEVMLDLELRPDQPLDHDCGRCALCLANCPTGAITGPYTVDSPRCTSFQTIENRGWIPRELRSAMTDWVFGCDICQEVCPYTIAAKPQPDPELTPRSIENAWPDLEWLLLASDEQFRLRFGGTPVMRARAQGMARNAAIALGNCGDESNLPALSVALADPRPVIRGHAAWAVGQLGGSNLLDAAWVTETDSLVRNEISLALDQMIRQ